MIQDDYRLSSTLLLADKLENEKKKLPKLKHILRHST